MRLQLQGARERADDARALTKQVVGKASVTEVWSSIKRASDQGELTDDVTSAIHEVVAFHAVSHRAYNPNSPVFLTPWLAILSEKDGIRIVRRPYGTSGAPMSSDVHSSFIGSGCGSTAWNGAGRVGCGMMDDD